LLLAAVRLEGHEGIGGAESANDVRSIGVPPVIGVRVGGVSPARVPEASGWETRFFCSMKGAGSSRVLWFSFWDECRSGNSALLIAVAACYVQCSSGRAMGTRPVQNDRAFGVTR
jgi:hypothetical protein